MKSLLRTACLGLVTAAAGAAPCEVAALIGSAQRDGQALRVGSPLSPGDTVETAAGSRLRLRCSDGSSLVLAAGSRLRLDQFDIQTDGRRGAARFQLQLGLLGQQVSPGGGWSVRTPSAVTAVRGTEFVVELFADQRTAVLMQSGAVEVSPLKAQARGGLIAALPLVALAVSGLATECGDGRCSAAAPWSAERVQATLDRLAGV